MILFILDYASGTVFKHVLSKEENIRDREELFGDVCKYNNIRAVDCYYMYTENENIEEI